MTASITSVSVKAIIVQVCYGSDPDGYESYCTIDHEGKTIEVVGADQFENNKVHQYIAHLFPEVEFLVVFEEYEKTRGYRDWEINYQTGIFLDAFRSYPMDIEQLRIEQKWKMETKVPSLWDDLPF